MIKLTRSLGFYLKVNYGKACINNTDTENLNLQTDYVVKELFQDPPKIQDTIIID